MVCRTRVSDRLVSLALSKLKEFNRPIIVAVSGSQGSGKTTATRQAAAELTVKGVPCISISIDDFYLTFKDQQTLASKGNSLLQTRGLPGTHDIPLLTQTVSALKQGSASEVPIYDKSKHNGRGDRSNNTASVPQNLRVVFLEGWCVGFRPIGSRAVEAHRTTHDDATRLYDLKDLVDVDKNLEAYTGIWDTCDALFLMQPISLEYIFAWRLQQEHALWETRGQGMSDAEVKSFVNSYIPAYELYLTTIKSDVHIYLTRDREIRESMVD